MEGAVGNADVGSPLVPPGATERIGQIARAATALAALRQTDVAGFRRELSGDLDRIVRYSRSSSYRPIRSCVAGRVVHRAGPG